jgi:nicotinamide-nucleotide amidase
MATPILAEIFSQGDEVVTGQIADTNAAWLAQRLRRLGFDLTRHTTVGDRLERLVALLTEIAGRADCCICTGGLGPTVDDLTAEAVTQAFDLPLELDRDALAQIERYFATRGYAMPPTNRKQAMLPRGSLRLDNRRGTAPGFSLVHQRCYFAFLPGVPAEMQVMYAEHVEPALINRFDPQPDRLVTFRTIGLGESSLQHRLESLVLPAAIRLGFRAAVPENEVKLLIPAGYPTDEASPLIERAAQLLGEHLVSIDGEGHPGGDLASVCGRLLETRDATLATAETASAGQIAWSFRGCPWLTESLVVRDAQRLSESLELPLDRSSDSDRAARALACRLRTRSGACYALVNLGDLAAADDSHHDSPATDVAIALAGPNGLESSSRHSLTGSSDRRRRQLAALTLDLLRRTLDPIRSIQ